MKVTLTVCDICKNQDRPTKSYRLVTPERTTNTELCSEHAEPVELVVEQVLKDRPKASTRTRRPSQTRVTTMEEIEAQKSAQK